MISKSSEPLHENLNDVLQHFSTEESFNELLSNVEFSMGPVLQSVHQKAIVFILI